MIEPRNDGKREKHTIALLLVKEDVGILLGVSIRNKEHLQHVIEGRFHVGLSFHLIVTLRGGCHLYL